MAILLIIVSCIAFGVGAGVGLWMCRNRSGAGQSSAQALRDKEERLRLIFESAPDYICEVDFDGTFLMTNRVAPGLTMDDVIGKTLYDFTPIGSHDLVRRTLEKVRDTGEPGQYLSAGEGGGGTRRWYVTNVAPIKEDGVVKALMLVATDVTDVKGTEDTLIEIAKGVAPTTGQTFFRSLVRHLTGVLNVNYAVVSEVIRNGGDRLETIAVCKDDEIVDDFGYDIAGTPCELVLERQTFTCATNVRETFPDVEILKKLDVDGYIGTPLIDSAGKTLGLLFVLSRRPIENARLAESTLQIFATRAAAELERKRYEEERSRLEQQMRQSQKMEALGQLAGGIAHDFNNLLTAIIGNTEMLQDHVEGIPEAPAECGVSLAQIQRASQRAAGMTRQLLAFSRKQMGRMEAINPNITISEMQSMLQRLIGEHILLKTQLDPSVANVTADPAQLEQVIMNLVLNARDAMPEGGRLTVTTGVIEVETSGHATFGDVEPGPHVCVTVSDTGGGIAPETIEHVFEPFYTTKPVGEGTGLGLPTVYGIVVQCGGHLRVDTTKDGTSFHAYFPVATSEPQVKKESPRPRRETRGNECILVCEDEDMVRELTCKILSAAGYQVLEASDGPQALQLAEQHDDVIQLLLTDAVMPQMSGRELADQMVQRHPYLKVIFVSGYTPDVGKLQGVMGNNTDFMQKPFMPTDLLERVRMLLDESEVART